MAVLDLSRLDGQLTLVNHTSSIGKAMVRALAEDGARVTSRLEPSGGTFARGRDRAQLDCRGLTAYRC